MYCMRRKELLELYKEKTGGKTTIEAKPADPDNPVPYQISKVTEYQMTGRR